MDHYYKEIDEALLYIQSNLFEPLTLPDIARYVGYSPYHFARIFKQRIGLSPLYYVSALRLQKAKDLLLHTSFSIRDISLEIGQQSLGTFTSRFTEKVGMTPSAFRDSAYQAEQPLHSLQHLSVWQTGQIASPSYNRITGRLLAEVPFEGIILIGLFAKPIPEGLPLYGTLLPGIGEFSFTNVNPGTYYLMGTSVSWGMQAKDFLLPQATLRTRSRSPITVKPYTPVPFQEVMLHLPQLDDPPILISLPLLMNNFLKRIKQI